ncbi:unnamed protein product [Linum tenue]|uniref:Uncharacterized protein n=1 Tax=Linum tenue TaxID=586396 RepID=A0AAV0N445_9ROSI|nr:unnamed protein product [Linum tenue]
MLPLLMASLLHQARRAARSPGNVHP